MFSYMIGEEDVGSYRDTYNHTLGNFIKKDPCEMAKKSGTTFDPTGSSFIVPSLGQELVVRYPEGTVRFRGTVYTPLWSWRLIVLNHLARADNAALTGSLIPYKELEAGYLFNPAFLKMACVPIVDCFAHKPVDVIKNACSALNAVFKEEGDVCAVFQFLPRFPITLKFWLSDAEIPGSANFLFDAAANSYLHTEDIAVAASLISTFLLAQYEHAKQV